MHGSIRLLKLGVADAMRRMLPQDAILHYRNHSVVNTLRFVTGAIFRLGQQPGHIPFLVTEQTIAQSAFCGQSQSIAGATEWP